MQQYQKLVYTVCLQFVHNPHTAEDLTQDTNTKNAPDILQREQIFLKKL